MSMFDKLQKTDAEIFVHFTLLLYCVSTGQLQPKNIFKIGSQSEHGIYSKKFEQITDAGINYNYGLAKASEFIKETLEKSEVEFNRFLVRLSQLINLGEELSEHLFTEVNLILQNYVAEYHRKMESIKLFMGMFNSIMSISAFMVGATSILNMMSGSSTGNVFVTTLTVSMLALAVYVVMMYMLFPRGKIVNQNSDDVKKIMKLTYVAIIIGIVLGIVGLLVEEIPLVIAIGIAGVPFIIPGYLARKLENKVKLLDQWYPIFVKDFGNVYNTVGTVNRSLNTLMRSDFSLITPHLKRMYNRSNNRTSISLMLELFADESNSFMIKSGNQILKHSLVSGANMSSVGQTVHNIFAKIIELRKIRDQTSKSFFSMIVIMHILSLFIFALIIKISTIFTNVFEKVDGFQAPFEFAPLDPVLVEYLLPIILIVFSLINGMAIKVGEGGYYKTFLFYLGILLVSGGFTLFISDTMIGYILSDQSANLDQLVGDEFKSGVEP